jgi:uncharacterized phage protein gp47/JayE
MADRHDGLYQEMEDIYNSDSYETAEGVNLDGIAKNRYGLYRVLEDYSSAVVEYAADAKARVEVGDIVATEDDIEFIVQSSAVESGGKITVAVKAAVAGMVGNVPAGTITVIKTPRSGLNSVTNPTEATLGRDRETDNQFRSRISKSLARGGSGTIPSIYAALLELPGVVDADVTENDTSAAFPNGQPRNSIAAMVYGGTDADIAQTLFSVKGGAIRAWGTTNVVVTDTEGKTHTIGFSRPPLVTVWVRVTLTKNSNYPADGDEQVTTAIVKYIGGTDADSTTYSGLGLGEDVIRYKIGAAAGVVAGIDDILVETSVDGNVWTTDNISVDSASKAITDSAKVVIV